MLSYSNKITNYQADCDVILKSAQEKHQFSDYIKAFAETQIGKGCDIGSGPQGFNGRFFKHVKQLDGCDLELAVVNSLPRTIYTNIFQFKFGNANEHLPYQNSELDFVVSSCVIQHLSDKEALELAFREVFRVLHSGGQFYCMFKAGTHDTDLSHWNEHYQEQRTFRVFDPVKVKKLAREVGFSQVLDEHILLDSNWIPYSCIVFQK